MDNVCRLHFYVVFKMVDITLQFNFSADDYSQ